MERDAHSQGRIDGMLKLNDFLCLPELEQALEPVISPAPGCIILAGLDPRPAMQRQLLSSGRSTMFRILINEQLAATPGTRAVVVAEDPAAFRIPRQWRGRVSHLPVRPPHTYASRIAE